MIMRDICRIFRSMKSLVLCMHIAFAECVMPQASLADALFPLTSTSMSGVCHLERYYMLMSGNPVYVFKYEGNQSINITCSPMVPYGVFWTKDVTNPKEPFVEIKRGSQDCIQLLNLVQKELYRLQGESKNFESISSQQKDELIALWRLSIMLVSIPPPWPYEPPTEDLGILKTK